MKVHFVVQQMGSTSDYHTFFVGERGWGFSVWVHNDELCELLEALDKARKAGASAEKVEALQARLDALKRNPAFAGEGPLPKSVQEQVNQLATDIKGLQPAVRRGTLTGSLDDLTVAEKKFVEDQLSQGRNIEIVPRGVSRTPDFKIDGLQREFKTLSGVADQTPDGLSKAMASRIMDGRGQAADIIVDARGQAGMTREIAERGIRRAYGADNKLGGKIQSITVILPDGSQITVLRAP
jgi:hypothetical protein